MRCWLLLIWAQGLRRVVLLASGAMAGTVVTKGNISAEEGGSIILQCHLTSTTAEVTQVNWEQQDQLLAIYHTDLGWHIDPGFSKRVTPGPGLGLTFQSLMRNDTGEYFCIYHTYPDGIYRGTVFLEVLGNSVAEHSSRFQIPLLGAVGTVLVVICAAVIRVVALARKRKPLRIRSAESGLGRVAAEPPAPSASAPAARSRVQPDAAPAGLCAGPAPQDCEELHDYFNVLSYRSLGSFRSLAQAARPPPTSSERRSSVLVLRVDV